MAKVEVITQNNLYLVQVTFREPFEDLFEIAQHIFRFEDEKDASLLADRVKEKIKAIGLSKSVSFALTQECWNYVSSVSDIRYNTRYPTHYFGALK